MKRMVRIQLSLAVLLALMLAFSVAATANEPVEGAFPVSKNGALTIQRRYELASTNVGVYREGKCTTLWGTLPAGTVLQVERLSTGFVTVTINGMVGYIDAAATRLLAADDKLYANRPTRVYQRPNTACKYVEVPAGIDVTFVAMSGKIVQVKRNGVTGYMLIDHLSGRRGNRST